MTLVTVGGYMYWPGYTSGITAAPALATNTTVDAAGEYDAVVFCAQEAMTISHVGLRVGTVSGSGQLDIRIETVATDGSPSGALWATNTNIVTTAGGGVGGTSIATNTFTLWALTASASIAMGQVFCVRMSYSSGTSVIIQRITGIPTNGGIPYAITNTGTPTKSQANLARPWALGSGATTFYKVVTAYPATAVTANTVTAGGGVAAALRFKVPFKCRCIGISSPNGTSTGDLNAMLQDDSNNELSSSSTAFDGDQMSNVAAGVNRYFFDNPVTLTTGTTYRAVLDPQTSNITVYTATLPSTVTDYVTAYLGGTESYYSTRSGTTWTDDNTRVPFVDILIDQVDDGAAVAEESSSAVNVVTANVGVLTNTIGY